MTDPADIHVRVVDTLDVADVRRRARQLAESLNFRSAKVYRLSTAVSELANNLYFHTTQGGTITIRPLTEPDRTGIEVLCVDEGPGIPDIGLAMKDGYSTNRGLGAGLPGVRRLMDDFAIESVPGQGTRIRARMWRP